MIGPLVEMVTVFPTTKEEVLEAEKHGPKGVVAGGGDAAEALEGQFDFILSTIPEKHKVDPFIPLLKHDAAYVSVGALAPMPVWTHMNVIMGASRSPAR